MLLTLLQQLKYLCFTKEACMRLWGLACILCSANTSFADELKTVNHYVLHYPPYWQVTNNNISGFHYAMTKRIYQEANLQPNYIVMPYARIAAIKNDPNTQVISYGSLTPDENSMLFPVPPTVIALNAYALKPNPPKRLVDYKGARIAVKRGFPLGEYAEILDTKQFYTVELGTIKAAIQLLLYDRVDYVITLADPFDSTLRLFQLPENRIYKTSLSRLYGHPIAINANNNKANELYQRINQSYKKLEQQGEIIFQDNQTLLKADYQKFLKE